MPEVGERDEANERPQRGSDSLESFREKVARRDSSLETRDHGEPGKQVKLEQQQVDSEGGNSKEGDRRTGEGESDLDRCRLEVREKYQSRDESPDAGASNHSEVAPAKEQQPTDRTERPPDLSQGHGQQDDVAQLGREQGKGTKEEATPGAATVEAQHEVAAEGQRPDNRGSHGEMLPTDSDQSSATPDRNLPDALASIDSPSEKTAENSATEVSPVLERDSVVAPELETPMDRSPVPDERTHFEVRAQAERFEDSAHETPEATREDSKAGPNVQAEGGEAREHLADFSSTAFQQASDGRVRFEVRVESLEEQAGVKFESGKVYAVGGEIDGVSDFRKVYAGGGSSDRIAFYPSMESQWSVTVGEKYNVHVDSVKEISATSESMGSFYATGYSGTRREDSVRFDIPVKTFEKRTGERFEDGKTYEIKGRIGDHEFKLTHTGNSENTHLFISAPRRHAKEIQPGKEQTITVTSVEEKRTLMVIGEGHRTRLTIQERMLESLGVDVDSMKKAGSGERLVEMTVRNLSGADRTERKVYGRVQPNGALPLSIGNLGAKHGDKFEIAGAREHTVRNFVDGFNRHRGESARNVGLSFEGEKLFFQVDGKRFGAKSYKLDVHHLQTFLNLEVQPFKHDIRLWYDGDKTKANFARPSRLMQEGSKPPSVSWRIRSFQVSERGLEVAFVMGDRTVTARGAPEPLKERMSAEEISKRIKVGVGDRLEESHPIRIEDDLVSHINDRITSTKWSNSPYFFERGSFGEDIGSAAMSKMGWEELSRHPFDENGPGRDAHKKGTDALYKNQKTAELILVEFRWWKNADAGLEGAVQDVGIRRQRETYHPEFGQISGAYVASLNLEPRSNRGELRVKRAW